MKLGTGIAMAAVLAAAGGTAQGFNGETVTDGPVTLTIGPIADVTEYDAPRDVEVTLRSAAAPATAGMKVRVRMVGLVDEWRAVGATEADVTVPAGGEAKATFRIAAGKGACSALYPVHVQATFDRDGAAVTVRAVRIFQSRFARPAASGGGAATAATGQPAELPLNVVPADGSLGLAELRTARAVVQVFGQAPVYMPVGWRGAASPSLAFFEVQPAARGSVKTAVNMHPPWKNGPGTIFAEYRLALPATTPLALRFANAIRDNGPDEPPSDGVTFRVWAAVVEADKAGAFEKLFERHTDSKVWLPGEASLDALAGKQIVLRLESHPGPKNDTTCDSSYWGEPTILVGKPTSEVTPEQREQLRRRARQAVGGTGILPVGPPAVPAGAPAVPAGEGKTTGKMPVGPTGGTPVPPSEPIVFPLADGYVAAIVPGAAGLADGAIALGKGDKCVVFDGLRVSVLDRPSGVWPGPLVVRSFDVQRQGKAPDEKVTIRHHHAARAGGAADANDWSVTIWVAGAGDRHTNLPAGRQVGEQLADSEPVPSAGAGLRMKVSCPNRITDVALGPADRHAPRVYYGHGYVIDEPKAFRAGFGGHDLASSHVGFEFDNGAAVLTACDNPPDYLAVDPSQRHYALHTHLDATFTLVPSAFGAVDAACRYRPLYDKPAAGGVKRKAGRFVFDIWGGKYTEIAATMSRMIDYGLTDSMLTVHDWQRWGYDYRLPDIYPPQPGLGTPADVRKIAAVCKAADIPWGLHDNYIDFYPDANGFSYDHMCFTPSGEPIKAWLNEWRGAQSYRWRPDAFAPFLKRNLEVVKRELAPTAYFIDVFTSMPCWDYYDRKGAFHPMTQTRQCWGEAFAWIRQHLGGDAPTSSEAGDDQLVGYLDGADCQFIQLSPTGGYFHNRLACGDWERTPWFDAVLHDRFILHGVGYSDRYEGGRSRLEHGIESDDYVSAELLTGHALMIDRGAFGAGAVRKYWLAQDFVRSIAMGSVAGVEFAGGDIHRQVVTWAGGAKVYVNRGAADWAVAGRTLPQYGYYAVAAGGRTESSIERIDGVIVEQSRGPSGMYVNGRGTAPGQELRVRPQAERIEDLGGGRFRLALAWQVDGPVPKDLSAFLHFTDVREKGSREKIAFQGDFHPDPQTGTWKGRVVAGPGQVISVPDGDAKEYAIGVGLWDPVAKRRFPLLGTDEGGSRYLLGRLVVDRDSAGKATSVRLVKHEPPPVAPPRWNVEGKPIDFGSVVTAGAVRCRVASGVIVVTPLPEAEPFEVALRLSQFSTASVSVGAKAESVAAVDAAGKQVRAVPVETKDGLATFKTGKGEFAYKVTVTGKWTVTGK